MPPTDTRDLLSRSHQTRIMSDHKFIIESLCEPGLSSSPPTSRRDLHAGRIRGTDSEKRACPPLMTERGSVSNEHERYTREFHQLRSIRWKIDRQRGNPFDRIESSWRPGTFPYRRTSRHKELVLRGWETSSVGFTVIHETRSKIDIYGVPGTLKRTTPAFRLSIMSIMSSITNRDKLSTIFLFIGRQIVSAECYAASSFTPATGPIEKESLSANGFPRRFRAKRTLPRVEARKRAEKK